MSKPPQLRYRQRLITVCGLLFLLLMSPGHPAWAQIGGGKVPSLSYYSAISELYRGEYRDAERALLSELRGSIKTPQSRWIDAICYYTMLGECHYQLGENERALRRYDEALQLYLAFPDWMIRVKFPSLVKPGQSLARKVVPWGRSSRTLQLGQFRDSMLVAQGRINNNDVVRQGGVVQQALFLPINIHEIVRCTALSLRRRRELLGPLSKHDKMTEDLVVAMSRRQGPPNHWSEVWTDVQLGLAYAASGNTVQANTYLTRSLLVAGQFDHPLTSTAFLELGRLAQDAGDFGAAAQMFAEATYSAFYFENMQALEEGFQRGVQTHLMAGREGLYPPLLAAAHWAQSNRLRQLQVWLTLLTAENYASDGQSHQGQALLNTARSRGGRRGNNMAEGLIGGQANYLRSLISFQLNKPDAATKALTAALANRRHSSKWLFQISLATNRYAAGNLKPRDATVVLDQLLRDPTAADWGRDPLESLAVLTTPHYEAFQHWFDAALKRREVETAVEIADRARRHAFHSSLPLGGRLLALRWILETKAEELSQNIALQRQELLLRYPRYDELSQRVRIIKSELKAAPLPDPGQDDRTALWDELAEISVQQEAMLREIALWREASDLVFPPIVPTAEIMARLPDRHALMVLFAVGRRIHCFMLNNQQYRTWKLDSPKTLRTQTVRLLRELGNHDPNRELKLATITSKGWRSSSHAIMEQILEGSRIDLTEGVDELAIVPDSFLWYLPFEALAIGDDPATADPMLSHLRVRYVPTASLAVPDNRPRPAVTDTTVVIGKLYPRDSDSVAEHAFEQLSDVVPGAIALRPPLPAPSPLLASITDTLVVLDDITIGQPYDWAPIELDHNLEIGTLKEWFALPWGGPDQIILPGFHTAAESALQRRPPVAGRELFLSVCGLMSCGARTVLLSRWRTGGQTSFDLVREFVQELPHTGAADAWQRSVQLSMDQQIDSQLEPRIKNTESDDPPTANHPFFWSGYMLVDTGGSPHVKEEPLDAEPEPVVKFKQPAQDAPSKK